jgi:PAS domain S-box-containing protein
MFEGLPAKAVLEALLEGLDQVGIGCTIVRDHGDRLERIYANRTLAAAYGLDVETMRSLPPMNALKPDERDRVEAVRTAMTPGPAFIQTEVVRPDGTSAKVDYAFAYGELGGTKTAFAFVRDPSTRPALEAALRESEERFRRIAEASPDSIAIYGEDDRCIWANPIALRLRGVASLREVVILDNPWGRVPEDRRAELREYATRVRRGEKPLPFQLRLAVPSGEERIIEVSLSRTSIGGALALISYTRDITERVRLQAELVNRDRLATLGTLAAGVAHELNNPLTSLGMQVRRLYEDADKYGLPKDVKESIGQMSEATTRMNAIIGDLLFMARPVERPQAHVDVGQIIGSTVALLRAGTPNWPTVHVHLDPTPCIEGYSSKLGQVFLNVLRNAVQAVSGRDDALVQVTARAQGDWVEVTIVDNGPGVPSDVLPRVTEPFFTTKPLGTGLGLWISQTLIALHGGSLDLRSDEGVGTTVTVRLPQKLGAAG